VAAHARRAGVQPVSRQAEIASDALRGCAQLSGNRIRSRELITCAKRKQVDVACRTVDEAERKQRCPTDDDELIGSSCCRELLAQRGKEFVGLLACRDAYHLASRC
jgi:hypothetical protein